MGGGGSGSQIIPFDMSALVPFMPSVFNGPYNAQGGFANEQMISQRYPWITPPAGQFAGAQPGQFANSTAGSGFSGITPAPPPNPPIPSTVVNPAGGGAGGGGGMSNPTSTFNPMQASSGMPNAMQPTTLQQIMAVMSGQGPSVNNQWQTNPTPSTPPTPQPQTNPLLAFLNSIQSLGRQ